MWEGLRVCALRFVAVLAVGALLGASGPPATAQEAVATGSFTGTEEVGLVEVPVLVVDADGRPVRGLAASAFQVLADDVAQEVTNFAAPAAAPSDAPLQAEGADTGRASAEVVPTPGAAPSRTLAVLLDLSLLRQGEANRAVAAMRSAWATGPPAGTTVWLYSFDGSLHLHGHGLASGDEITAALDGAAGVRARGLHNAVRFADDLTVGSQGGQAEDELRARTRLYFDEIRRASEAVGTAVEEAVRRLAGAPGATLVVVTPGMPWTPTLPPYLPDPYRMRGNEPRRADWGRLGRTAAAAGVTVYVVDPTPSRRLLDHDVANGASFDDVPMEGAQGAGGGFLDRQDFDPANATGSWLERYRYALMDGLTEPSGGRVYGAEPLAKGLAAVEERAAASYVLAFRPDHPACGQLHRLEVRLAGHPELRVSARRWYRHQSLAARDAAVLGAELRGGEPEQSIGVRLELGSPEREGRGVRVPVTLKIPFARLEMVTAGTRATGRLRVAALAEDPRGAVSPLWQAEQPLEVPAADLERARRIGYFTYRMTLELERRRTTVRFVVEDLLGGGRDTLVRELDLRAVR